MNINDLAMGIDLSRFNTSEDGKKKVDFDIIKASVNPIVRYVAMRSGICWGYTDAWFQYYFQECKRVGLPRAPYHVIYFGESPLAQMDNFYRILGAGHDEIHDRLVLDLEVAGSNSRLACTDTTLKCMQILKSRTGRNPILYSRAGWVNEHLYSSWFPADTDWWLAQYRFRLPWPLYTPEYNPPPTLPKGVGRWLVHQTAEYQRSIGAPGRYYMDWNRWNGDANDVLNYFGYDGDVDPEPEEPEVIEPLFSVKFKAYALYLRNAPVNGEIVGAVTRGDPFDNIHDVYEVDGATGWYRLSNGWCSGSLTYWEKVR